MVTELDLSHNNFCESGGEHLGDMLGTDVLLRQYSLWVKVSNTLQTFKSVSSFSKPKIWELRS